MDDLTEIKQRLDALEMRRVHQSDIPPSTIKQRHMGQGNRFIRSGLEADLPEVGEGTSDNSSPIYYATDTGIIHTWNGTEWLGGLETFSAKFTTNSTANSTTFVSVSPEMSITFTPKYSNKYIIFSSLSIESISGNHAYVKIVNTQGSAEIIIEQIGSVLSNADATYNAISSMYIYTIANLKKGIEYKFELQERHNFGSVTQTIICNSLTPLYLVAQSL